MDAGLRDVYAVLGTVNTAIRNEADFEPSMRACLRAIAYAFDVSYATIWTACAEPTVLRPTYWLGNVDITSRVHASGEGAVGTAFATQRAVRDLDCADNPDPSTVEDYAGITVTSTICVPFSTNSTRLGVVQLVNKNDGTAFTEAEADVVEMAAMICAMRQGKEARLPSPWKPGRSLMEIVDVTREYRSSTTTTKVLQGVNLIVNTGEFLVLLGESGCGKSTLLNIMAGLDETTTGQVRFGDDDHTESSEHELTKFRRQHVGMIFQNYNLISNLNTRRNLSIIGELVDDPLPIDEALELVGLSEHADKKPSQLSGGQQQRVSIARALIKRPPLILADEPTAALDYETSIEVLEALERVRAAATTLVMVTHNEEICRMADRVVRMRNGRISEVSINLKPARATQLLW